MTRLTYRVCCAYSELREIWGEEEAKSKYADPARDRGLG